MGDNHDADKIREGKMVCWIDPRNEDVYGSGPGPFLVVRVAKDSWTPVCTCGGKGGGLLENGHSWRCEIRFGQVEGLAVTVVMNGRHRTFPQDLFRIVKS